MALITTAQLMLAINQNNTAQTTRYDLLRRQVEAAIKSYVKWPIEQDTVTEFYDGTAYKDLILRRPFVSSVTSVYEDDTGYYGQGNNAFAAATLLTAGQDYALVAEESNTVSKCGLLRRLSNQFMWFPSQWIFYRNSGGLAFSRGPSWPQGFGNIKVTYTYGFVPALNVTAASWSGGVITFTTSTAPGFTIGQRASSYGCSPDGYNVTGRVTAVGASSVSIGGVPIDPGTLAGAGTISGIPEDIQLAVATMVSIVQNSVKYGWPVQSESLGDYNYSIAIARDVELGSVRQLLGQYRDMQMGAAF